MQTKYIIMNPELLTRKQVAEYFKVIYDTVQNWEKKGIIKPSCTINGRPRYILAEVIEAITQKKGGNI